MSTRTSPTNRFQQLRWKLTLNYTAVTVAALITIELLLLGMLAAALYLLLNSGAVPLSFDPAGEMLVVGSDGTLLGARPSDLLGSEAVGRSVDTQAVPGLAGTAYDFQAARGLVRRLDRLSKATLAWSQGDFSTHVEDSSGDELGQLAERLNNMPQELAQLVETRRALAVMDERNRLARELHDSAKHQAVRRIRH